MCMLRSNYQGPLVWHGRHFLRVVYAFANFSDMMDEGGHIYKAVTENKKEISTLRLKFVPTRSHFYLVLTPDLES